MARGTGTDDGVAADPIDLATWGLHCYCPRARQTPHSLVHEGSNGRLLYEARAGTTRSSLRAGGVPVTEEQVAQLVTFGLLAADGDRLQTRFPVLGGAITIALRRRLRRLGAALAGLLTPGVTEVLRELADRGLTGSGYAVVFGYALDGLLWGQLRASGAVPDTALCIERPWWNGAFWAVHPERDGSAGTDFVDCGRATLALVWTDATLRGLGALSRAEHLPHVVAGLLAEPATGPGVVADRDGGYWRFRRPDGRRAVPILGAGGRLDVLAGALAGVVADALLGDESAAARDLIPTEDRAVATVVVAHELIWELTEALIESGALQPPPALLQSGVACPDTLVDLLYLDVGEA